MINDKDFDGIPDEFDNTFNTPEEVLKMKGIENPLRIEIDEEQLYRILNSHTPCMIKQKDDNYTVIFDKEYETRIKAAANPPKIYKKR